MNFPLNRAPFFFGAGLLLHNFTLALTYLYVFLWGFGFENNPALSFLASKFGFFGAALITNVVILSLYFVAKTLDTQLGRILRKNRGIATWILALALFAFMQYDAGHDLGVMFGVL